MRWLYIFSLIFVVFSCEDKENVEPLYTPDLMEIPKGFPEIDFPVGNEFTESRWELGKKLFYDPIMSSDGTISCASCHRSELAFSDDIPFSEGVDHRLGTRNSPSLANVAYHPYFTREGGVPTLEMQILVPIQEHLEFDFNIILIAERLQNDPTYVEMAQLAYEQEPNAFVITRALACFERSLLSGYSRYDQYTNYEKTDALTENEIRGMNLFLSDKTKCSQCHNGFNFSNYTFANNGLYEEYPDTGRFRLTGEESDRALFKVPSLRNVELTAPYMHDGSINSLEEIIEHYQSGGENHTNKSNLIQPLNLSEQEKTDLILFLKSLTDETFINNPLFKK
jgi:cytochrome c peroxidase